MGAAGPAGWQGLFSRLSRRGGNYSSKLRRQGEGEMRRREMTTAMPAARPVCFRGAGALFSCRTERLLFSGTCFALMGTNDSVWLFFETIVTLLVHSALLSAPSWCK
jgi:hypothetical protein